MLGGTDSSKYQCAIYYVPKSNNSVADTLGWSVNIQSISVFEATTVTASIVQFGKDVPALDVLMDTGTTQSKLSQYYVLQILEGIIGQNYSFQTPEYLKADSIL